MNLAKDVIDFGLYTNDRERLPEFWQTEIGLPFEETLPAGGGVHQTAARSRCGLHRQDQPCAGSASTERRVGLPRALDSARLGS